jgi:formylmethanofuran dehydrogenase subunit E
MVKVDIEKSLYDEIMAFCELNEIADANKFINETLKKGFDMKKYGDSFAFFFNKSEDEIVHVKNTPEPEPEPVAEVKKKGGRKKKEQPKEEEIVAEPEVVIEQEPIEDQPKEPVYKIKEEEVKKPEKKYVTLRNKRDDNYDVYDTI